MSKEERVDSRYGDSHRYDVSRKSGFWSDEFVVRREDGKYIGAYKSLAQAVKAAEEAAKKNR